VGDGCRSRLPRVDEALLLLAHDGEALVGVAALATDNAEKSKFLFLCGNTADYCDFICAPARRAEFVDAVLGELSKLQLPILRLANLPADSATCGTIKDAARRHGYLVFSRPAYQCAQIRLGSAAERQELKQSVAKRKAFRYYLKGMEKTGPVTMDHLRYWDAVRPNLPRFTEAHVARFLTNGRASNLAKLGEAGLSLGARRTSCGRGVAGVDAPAGRRRVGSVELRIRVCGKLVLLPANL